MFKHGNHGDNRTSVGPSRVWPREARHERTTGSDVTGRGGVLARDGYVLVFTVHTCMGLYWFGDRTGLSGGKVHADQMVHAFYRRL